MVPKMQKMKNGVIFILILLAMALVGKNPFFLRAQASTSTKVFAFYYLWWTENHWHTKMGPNYPYTVSPHPLPATVDPQGCSPVSLYSGNQLTDVSDPFRDIDTAAMVEEDVRNAVAANLSGFIVNWSGTGSPTQTISSTADNKRLASVFAAVNKVRSEGAQFSLWISYKASASIKTLSQIQGDLTYLAQTYGTNPALDRTFSSRPIVIWQGSRKYDLATIAAVSNQFRSTFFLVGDENHTTWTSDKALYFDGDSNYWSTQNPYTNPSSFSQIQQLATMVRSGPANPDGTKKLWLAPLTPGYNSILNGGSTCVPRTSIPGSCPVDSTVQTTAECLFAGNKASNPDAWTLISWNEIAEGSYILPLTRWGSTYTNLISSIVLKNQPVATLTPTPTIKPGDANGDGKVDEADYGIWLAHFATTVTGGASVGDFDGSGIVDGVDYVIWLNNTFL
jgi:hypothetical protein